MTILTTIQQWINQFNLKTDLDQSPNFIESQLKQLNWQWPRFSVTDANGNTIPLQFRWGNIEDVDVLMELQSLAYKGYAAWHELDFKKDFTTNPYRLYLLAELPGAQPQLVGVISGRCQHIKGHISHIMVHPAYQDVGLGKYLLSQWLEIMCLLNVQRVELEVAETNERALKLYRRFGFKKGKTLINYYRLEGHAYRMVWYNQDGELL